MVQNNQPLIAIDVAALHFDGRNLNIILGERKFEPFKGENALPGVLLLANETLEQAAQRALETKIGQNTETVSTIRQVGAYDNPDRDPRGPTISILFYSISETLNDTDGTTVTAVNDLSALPFDHNALVSEAVQRLSQTVLTDKEALKSLLGETFTTAAMKNLIQQLKINLNHTNLTRFLRNTPFLEETEATAAVPGQKGRPAKLWRIK